MKDLLKSACCMGGAMFLLASAWATYTSADSVKPVQTPHFTASTSSPYITLMSVEDADDLVSILWSYFNLAKDDTLHIEVRERGSTNAWTEVYRGPIYGNSGSTVDGLNVGQWGGVIVNATNMVGHLWTEYISPVVVRTNGVYRLDLRQVMTEDYTAVTNEFIAPVGLRKE